MKRGHSNINASRGNPIEPWPGDTEIARIPIGGGGSVTSWREHPPLALRREEWERIGRAMGWLPDEENPDA